MADFVWLDAVSCVYIDIRTPHLRQIGRVPTLPHSDRPGLHTARVVESSSLFCLGFNFANLVHSSPFFLLRTSSSSIESVEPALNSTPEPCLDSVLP